MERFEETNPKGITIVKTEENLEKIEVKVEP